MAIYHPDRPTYEDRPAEDIGHGTRMGFRAVSLFGIFAFIALIAWFAFGPTSNDVSVVNSPAGDTNTPAESMAAPPQQPTQPALPQTAPTPPETAPALPQTAPTPTPPQPATP